jgi:hypothetical protein
MKSIARWTLSSSLLIASACTPAAVGTPEPEMAVPPVRFSEAGSSPADTLSVRISGPNAVPAATTVRYAATITNGTAARHYYWWFVAACAKGSGCAPSSYQMIGEGEGRDDITVVFGRETVEKDVVVQVAEINGDGRTGSSPEFPVDGPARRMGGAEGFSGGVCDWYAGSFYPHTGTFTDPFTGRSWQRGFRRDYCGNRVSWEPGGAVR